MVVHAFLANGDTAQQLRSQGRTEIRYPYKDKTFYPLMWPTQAMRLEDRRIVLPMGRGRPSLILPKPGWLTEKHACKIVWNGLHNELHVSIAEDHEDQLPLEPTNKHATVDLGQIHQAAVATNDGDALIVSGRGIRSLKRHHSQQLGEIARKRSRCTKGSRRWRKLGRARAKLTLHYERRVRDLRHKGTRQVVDFCKEHEVESVFVGNPDGVRRKNSGRHHNQRMSQWEYGRDIDYLQQKSEQDRIVHCGPHGPYLRPGRLRRSSRPDTGHRTDSSVRPCLAKARNQGPQDVCAGSLEHAHEPCYSTRSLPA